MSDDEGFRVVPEAERPWVPTLGEALDFQLQLDDQAWDAISDQAGRLEARLMIAEDVITVLEAAVFDPRSTFSRGTEGPHMYAVKIAGAVAGAVAAGAYLRWATRPVRGAYRVGRNLAEFAK